MKEINDEKINLWASGLKDCPLIEIDKYTSLYQSSSGKSILFS